MLEPFKPGKSECSKCKSKLKICIIIHSCILNLYIWNITVFWIKFWIIFSIKSNSNILTNSNAFQFGNDFFYIFGWSCNISSDTETFFFYMKIIKKSNQIKHLLIRDHQMTILGLEGCNFLINGSTDLHGMFQLK